MHYGNGAHWKALLPTSLDSGELLLGCTRCRDKFPSRMSILHGVSIGDKRIAWDPPQAQWDPPQAHRMGPAPGASHGTRPPQAPWDPPQAHRDPPQAHRMGPGWAQPCIGPGRAQPMHGTRLGATMHGTRLGATMHGTRLGATNAWDPAGRNPRLGATNAWDPAGRNQCMGPGWAQPRDAPQAQGDPP